MSADKAEPQAKAAHAELRGRIKVYRTARHQLARQGRSTSRDSRLIEGALHFIVSVLRKAIRENLSAEDIAGMITAYFAADGAWISSVAIPKAEGRAS